MAREAILDTVPPTSGEAPAPKSSIIGGSPGLVDMIGKETSDRADALTETMEPTLIGAGNKRTRHDEDKNGSGTTHKNKASKADIKRSSTQRPSLHGAFDTESDATGDRQSDPKDSEKNGQEESHEGNADETPNSNSKTTEGDSGTGGGGDGTEGTNSNTRNTENENEDAGGDNAGEENNDGDEDNGEESESEESEDGNVEIPLKELNKQLVCPLCDHYFRDAHTVPDCLHTFCKICIVHYCAIINASCPLCSVPIGDPTAVVKPDTVIQGLVDTVLSSDSMQPHVGSYANAEEDGDSKAQSADEGNGDTSKVAPKPREATTGANKSLRDYGQSPMQYICMKLEPTGKSSPQLSRPFLRTVGSLTVRGLLQYVAHQLNVSTENVELFCREMPLRGKEHQLLFVSRTMWRAKKADMVLRYEVKS